ncbi:MAG: hypothetical protein IJP78_05720 [Clostridia bacterium]|nr:hypothetical protein [Clostridia bacterium]
MAAIPNRFFVQAKSRGGAGFPPWGSSFRGARRLTLRAVSFFLILPQNYILCPEKSSRNRRGAGVNEKRYDRGGAESFLPKRAKYYKSIAKSRAIFAKRKQNLIDLWGGIC